MNINRFLFLILIIFYFLTFIVFIVEENSQIRDIFMLIFIYTGIMALLIKEGKIK